MKQLIENLRDNRVEVSREECAAALENLTAEIDKNGELLRYVEGLETMNCARIRELQAKNSALADEVGDYAKENVVLTAQRDALKAALHSISLASQDSGSTKEGMGLYARAAIVRAAAQIVAGK